MESRYRGERGQRGDKGEPGIKGPRGDKGNRGDKGIIGSHGLRGEKGETGEKGLKGEKGKVGKRGEIGDKGDIGDKGLKGDKGQVGDKGLTGDKGETGIIGEIGDKGKIGKKGENGERGPKGDKGNTGDKGRIGDKGETGIKGEIGPKGLTGDKGLTGEAGEKGRRGVHSYFHKTKDHCHVFLFELFTDYEVRLVLEKIIKDDFFGLDKYYVIFMTDDENIYNQIKEKEDFKSFNIKDFYFLMYTTCNRLTVTTNEKKDILVLYDKEKVKGRILFCSQPQNSSFKDYSAVISYNDITENLDTEIYKTNKFVFIDNYTEKNEDKTFYIYTHKKDKDIIIKGLSYQYLDFFDSLYFDIF